MPSFSAVDNRVWIILGIFAMIFALVVLVRFFIFLEDFTAELKNLNAEIRNSEGEEREYYKNMRRRLWLSLIPFVEY